MKTFPTTVLEHELSLPELLASSPLYEREICKSYAIGAFVAPGARSAPVEANIGRPCQQATHVLSVLSSAETASHIWYNVDRSSKVRIKKY